MAGPGLLTTSQSKTLLMASAMNLRNLDEIAPLVLMNPGHCVTSGFPRENNTWTLINQEIMQCPKELFRVKLAEDFKAEGFQKSGNLEN